jgi:hypothetical protein
VMSQLISRQIRDGNNLAYPKWILDHYFAAYYSFVFGQPDQFFLEFKNAKGEIHKKQVIALTKDSIRFFHQSRYASRLKEAGQGIKLEEYKDGATAFLKIKSFDPDLLRSLYQQDYKHSIDSIFNVLKHSRTANLILDLRDNQGGDFPPGRLLLSYLILYPSRFLMDGKQSRLIHPNANHFAGRVFVLINGGSFSSAAIVIAILEREKRGIFIGEETAGNKHIISGDPEEQVLPATRIRCFISTVTYRIIAGPDDGHGILPTYPVHPAIGDILMGNDISKARALSLISER